MSGTNPLGMFPLTAFSTLSWSVLPQALLSTSDFWASRSFQCPSLSCISRGMDNGHVLERDRTDRNWLGRQQVETEATYEDELPNSAEPLHLGWEATESSYSKG